MLEYAVWCSAQALLLQTWDECARLSGTELSHMSGRENDQRL